MVHAPRHLPTFFYRSTEMVKLETYFVALDETGHVMNSGYQTCAEYDTDPRNAR